MPQPIHIQDARLAQYLRLFSGVFSLPQWKYFVTVLLGLLHCDERRTLSALLRHVAVGVTIFGLCYFLRAAPWSVNALTAVRQAYFYEQVAPLVAAAHAEQCAQQPRRRGRRKRTLVTGYLIIDDSTHAKRYARAQEGLGSHYSGTEKKVVNGHSLYQSVYVLEGRQFGACQEVSDAEMFSVSNSSGHILSGRCAASECSEEGCKNGGWYKTPGDSHLGGDCHLRLQPPCGTGRIFACPKGVNLFPWNIEPSRGAQAPCSSLTLGT